MKKSKVLRNLIQADEILMMACVHDALSAVVAERAGFKSICLGGYGASASLLGMPDISLLTMGEMVDQCARVADRLEAPVFVDADTGHGGLNNVVRTVRSFERAGAAGLFIEDQVFPKRCGHMEGKEVVGREEMLSRIKAALDARTDPDFVIMGRTDALAVHGIDEAIERGRLMREAGADMIFVEAPTTVEQMQRINREIEGPTFTVFLEGGKIPLLSAREFQDLGFDVLAFAASGLYAAAYAMQSVFKEIVENGRPVESMDRMIQFKEFNELLGLSAIREKEKKYL